MKVGSFVVCTMSVDPSMFTEGEQYEVIGFDVEGYFRLVDNDGWTGGTYPFDGGLWCFEEVK